MTPRLLLPGPLSAGAATLNRAQQHYLKNVLRLRAEASVEVFDGAGDRWQGRTISQHRSLGLVLVARLKYTAPPNPRRWLAFAPIKAVEPVLRKATELGATDLLPVLSERVQNPRQHHFTRQQHHWASIIESAAAQCQQDHLPTLHDALPFDALLTAPPVDQLLLFDPAGSRWPATLEKKDSLLLLGPEGGWTEQELTAARDKGVAVLNLGPLVLRAETAPLAALVRLAAAWDG